jgi:hypothetical protein
MAVERQVVLVMGAVQMAARSLARDRGLDPSVASHLLMSEAARCVSAFQEAIGQKLWAEMLEKLAAAWEEDAPDA